MNEQVIVIVVLDKLYQQDTDLAHRFERALVVVVVVVQVSLSLSFTIDCSTLFGAAIYFAYYMHHFIFLLESGKWL